MYVAIEIIVQIVTLSLAFYGFWLLVGSPFLQGEIETTFRNWKRKRKIRRLQELNNVNREDKEKNFLIQHLELLLTSVSKSEKSNVFNFIFLTVLILAISLTTLISLMGDLIISLIVSLTFASLPYLIARFRLTTFRLKTQFIFLTEYHNVVQNYQSTGKSIYYTIQNVVKDTKDKDLKRVYMKLFSSLQKDRGNKGFSEAVTLFSYSINSTFSKRFAKLLMKAHLDQVDISLSLIDLNKDIKKRQQDMETEKTNKLETIIMGYFPIALFPLMFFCAYRISGVRDFWHYFQQKASITVFIIALVCSVISVLSAYISSKPRADI